MKQSRKRRNQKKKLILKLLLLLFLLTALISAWNVVSIMREYRTAEKSVSEMQQFIDLDATYPVETEPTVPSVCVPEGETIPEGETVPEEPTQPPVDPYPYPVVDFEALHAINTDVVGWIYIEDSDINYPIVQGTDNKRYIKQMVDGQYNAAGSIFMDYQNRADFSDRNTILYGHNMKNGSMFAQVLEYREPEFFEAHPTGVIITPENKFSFEIISGYVTDVYDDAWKLTFSDDDDYLLWLKDTMNRSIIGGTFDVSASDRVITLSTCTYEFEEARFVLICRILE